MTLRIIGDTHLNMTLTPNGGQSKTKKIDLQAYKEEDKINLDGYVFSHLRGLDISNLDTDSKEYGSLRQFTIRYNDRSEDAMSDMQDSYLRNHWDVSLGWPPQFEENEDGTIDIEGIINGRRRTGGAIEAKGNIIPIAVYKPISLEKSDLSKKTWISDDLDEEKFHYKVKYENAQSSNDQKGSVQYNKKVDYVQLGVDLVKKGIIKDYLESIGDWLEYDMKYKVRFPNPSHQSEILNKIYELAHADYELTDQWTTPDALQWLIDNGYLKKDKYGHWQKNVHHVSVDDYRYANTLIAQAIIPSILAGQNPPIPENIILYSKKRNPKDIRKNTLRFGDALEVGFINCFKMVEVMLGNTQTFNIPEYRPYTLSCIPQIKGEKGYGKNKTVPYEQVTKGVTYKGRDEILKDYPSLQDNKVSNLNKFLIDKSKQSIDLSLGVIS